MSDISPRLALPLLAAGQAQKELFHNEALATLDALVLPVFQPPQDTPPASPAIGSGWIVGSAPAADWSGRAGTLASWTVGGWRFVTAIDGAQVALVDGRLARRSGGSWSIGMLVADSLTVGGVQVVGARAAAIVTPAGGSTVDGQARAALSAVLAALRGHGLIAT